MLIGLAPISFLHSKGMKANEQQRTGRHLNMPSESNRQKPVNFREVGEGSRQISISGDHTSKRQKEWRQEIQEGEQAKEQSTQQQTGHAMPMDNDDTLGIP